MIDMTANITPMAVQMPADLIAEIRRIAAKNGTTMDELVQEACAQFVEPYEWERIYQEDRASVEASARRDGGLATSG